MEIGQVIAILGAVMAAGVPGIASAIGVGMTGEAVAGLVSEKPETFGQALVLQLLPGTQGVYGLLVGFVILLRIGVIGGTLISLSTYQGMMLAFGALPVAFVGWLSAIAQAKTAISGVSLLAKKSDEAGKAITMTVMVETYAVLALLISMLIVLLLPLGA